MSWIAVAVGGATLLGSIFQGNAAQSAAQTQANAAENAQNISLQEFNTITGQETPYMQSGYGALSNLDYLLGVSPQTAQGGAIGAAPVTTPGIGAGGRFRPGPNGSLIPQIYGGPATRTVNPVGPSRTGPVAGGTFGSLLTPFTADYMKQYSPAYQFQLQQGEQGILNQDNASQGALSGAALKDLIGYNQNYANTAFGNAFNQYQTQQQNTYNRLADIAQLGQTSAANTGQQGTALAGQAAQSAQNVGTALAAGQIGQANAYSSGLSNLATLTALNQAGGFGSSSIPNTGVDYSSGYAVG